eukprot:390039_1
MANNMESEDKQITATVSGISLITKGSRPEPPGVNEKVTNDNNDEGICANDQPKDMHSNDKMMLKDDNNNVNTLERKQNEKNIISEKDNLKQNELEHVDVNVNNIEQDNDVDVHGNDTKVENEYYTESDLLENDKNVEIENENNKLAELYKEMPARIYLEKTNVISAVTLALQSVTEERPKDAVEFVASYLLKYNETYKMEKNKSQLEGDESNVNGY